MLRPAFPEGGAASIRVLLVQYPSELVKNMGALLCTFNGRFAAYSHDTDVKTQKGETECLM